MTFFARPNLDDNQFRQLVDTTLTLSGETKINSVSGLSLNDGDGTYIPIIVTGASNGNVLMYDDVSKSIKLAESVGGGNLYEYSGLTTCSVGGIVSGSSLYNRSVSDILQDILSPLKYPTIIEPKINSYSLSNVSNFEEVGIGIPILTNTLSVSLGSISPNYPNSNSVTRSLGVNYFEYSIGGSVYRCTTNSITNTYSINNYKINYGNNQFNGKVSFMAGIQPKDSKSEDYSVQYTGGSLSCSRIVKGIYPIFFGKISGVGLPSGDGKPTNSVIKNCIDDNIVATGHMDVLDENGVEYLYTEFYYDNFDENKSSKILRDASDEITLTFNSTEDDYVWFAISDEYNEKTSWYVNGINNGNIGGATDLFSASSEIILSASIWGSVGVTNKKYKLYVSNYQTYINSINIK